MAFTQVGTITINPQVRQITAFPTLSFPTKGVVILSLETVPATTKAQFFGLEIYPFLTTEGIAYQRPLITKWQPSGFPLLIKYSAINATNPADTLKIGVQPTGLWPSRFLPKNLVLLLKRSDDNRQPNVTVN
jgi:hypothetical protein